MKKEKKLHPLIRERNERIQELLKIIEDNPETPFRKLMATFALKTGLSLRKVEEYVKILEATGKIRRYDKKIEGGFGGYYEEHVEVVKD
jgi:predicted transcriptional regulator